MPFYNFRRSDDTEYTELLKISELDEYILMHPNDTLIPSAPIIAYSRLPKPPEIFQNRLKEIKKSHARGNNSVNTF